MKNIFTIPNIISFFRILLIPLFVVAYFAGNSDPKYVQLAILIVVISGISDIVDGFIARHFKMVSDFGKVLDPIADKLTQASVVLCLSIMHPLALFPMFSVLFFKELLTLIVAIHLLSKGTKPISSKWFGKLSTVVIFATMVYTLLIDLFPHYIPELPLYLFSLASIVCMLISVTGYFKIFSKHVKGDSTDNETMR